MAPSSHDLSYRARCAKPDLAPEQLEFRGERNQLGRLTVTAGFGLQPLPLGPKQFVEDDVSTVMEMARREGIEIKRKPKRAKTKAQPCWEDISDPLP